MLAINQMILNNHSPPNTATSVLFPFIPVEADGYTLRHFLSFILKYFFPASPHFLILVYDQSQSVFLWGGLQQVDSFTFTKLIELTDTQLKALNPLLTYQKEEEKFQFLQTTLNQFGTSIQIGFVLQITLEVISDFEQSYNTRSNLLNFYANIWDLMRIHFTNKNIQFYQEPLFFKFFRRMTTKTANLDASQFKELLKILLPKQLIILSFLGVSACSSIALISSRDSFQLQFLNYTTFQQYFQEYFEKSNDELESVNETIKNKTRITLEKQTLQPSAAIAVTESFWQVIQKAMIHYRLESFLDQFLELSKKVETNWTIAPKIVLFRRWGKSFMHFQLDHFIPTQVSSVTNTILKFQYPHELKTCWFIVDDNLKLLYIFRVDFLSGKFHRIYPITDPPLFELFNSESNKSLAVRKVHHYLAEHLRWVHQIIVITVQDLQLLINFFPLLTSLKGSLKYLSIFENVITYRMYFYPPNLLASLIVRKGAISFFKDLMFPLLLNRNENRYKST